MQQLGKADVKKKKQQKTNIKFLFLFVFLTSCNDSNPTTKSAIKKMCHGFYRLFEYHTLEYIANIIKVKFHTYINELKFIIIIYLV